MRKEAVIGYWARDMGQLRLLASKMATAARYLSKGNEQHSKGNANAQDTVKL